MSESQLDAPPQKRQRSDITGDPRTRSEYWFQDGNIVLQVENTLFRVHQSILSRESQIFKDTFSMPQVPSQEDELIEGCPVVRLSDTAEDMGNIISLLYDGTRIVDNGFSVRLLGSMLRLGNKYAIDHIENKALRVLHHDYPKTLEEWDALSHDQFQIRNDPQLRSSTTSEVISIGHEFQLYTILPAAYARYLNQRLLKGIGSDDRLPEEARKSCLIGYARIMAYLKEKNVEAFCPPLVLPSTNCNARRKCDANKWQTIKDLPVWTTEETNPFGIFKKKYPEVTANLCRKCQAQAKRLTDEVRSDFWSVLPPFFELPAWTDLKDGP